MDYIIVNSEANNITSGTGEYISGTAIASKTSESPVDHPEEKGDTEYKENSMTGE